MKIPIGNTNNIGEQREAEWEHEKQLDYRDWDGGKERSAMPPRECTRAIDRTRPLIASRQRRKIGALVGRGAAGRALVNPQSRWREPLCENLWKQLSPSSLLVTTCSTNGVRGGWWTDADVAVKRVRNWANGADMSPPLRCLMPLALPATPPTKKGKQRRSGTVKGAELNNRHRPFNSRSPLRLRFGKAHPRNSF